MKYDYQVEAGRKFGHLTVLETNLKQELKNNPGHFQTVARCVCDCGSGKEVLVTPSALRGGLISSCGCLLGSKVKLGDRSGDLEVVKCGYKKGEKGNRQFMVTCKCHRCGGEKELLETVFRKKKQQNCGCIHRQNIAIGSRQGKLEVIGEDGQDANFNHLLKCRCDCGKEIVMTISRWNKHPTSCGCDRVEKGRVDSKGEYHVYGPIPNGTRFGHLVVTDGSIVRGAVRFAKCKCDCGNEITLPQSVLRIGNRTSCGCGGFVPVNVGDVFGLLTVVETKIVKSERTSVGCSRGRHLAVCTCSCGSGKRIVVSQSDLKRGSVSSCGCMRWKGGVTHGLSKNVLYKKLKSMINRCTDPKGKYAANYCLKGIRVCQEWKDQPESFVKWALANGYEYGKGLTVDRIDNNGDYMPENCRIVSQAEQNRNKGDTVIITFNGKSLCVAEWARELGVRETLLRGRMREGWSIEEMLTTPPGMTRGWRERMPEEWED